MLTFLNYAMGMWTVFTLCLQPPNWKHCTTDVDVWLFSEVQRGFDIWSGKEQIYQNEHDYLCGLDDCN